MTESRSPSDDRQALERMAREFTAGFNTGDVDRIMRFYDHTYVDVNLASPVQTWQERRAYYQRVMDRQAFSIDVQPAEILIDGHYAFIRGSIQISPRGAGEPTELRYVEIARKQADGSWKVMWGMNGPVQANEV